MLKEGLKEREAAIRDFAARALSLLIRLWENPPQDGETWRELQASIIARELEAVAREEREACAVLLERRTAAPKVWNSLVVSEELKAAARELRESNSQPSCESGPKTKGEQNAKLL